MKCIIQREDLRLGIEAVRRAMADASRPHCECVRLALRDAVLDIVATDGHRVHRFRTPVEIDGGGDRREVSIARSAVRELLAWLRASGAALVTIDFDTYMIAGTPFLRVTALDCDPKCDAARAADDAHFPPYDQVIPGDGARDGKRVSAIAWNAAYLADACASFAALRPPKYKRDVNLRFALGKDARDVVSITSGIDPRLTIALMPVTL